MAENAQADVKKLSFEREMEELESIVKRLEDGKVPLEESVAIYERGEALKRRCEELLRQAEARVEKITLDAAGTAKGAEPLDVKSREASLRAKRKQSRARRHCERSEAISHHHAYWPRLLGVLRTPRN